MITKETALKLSDTHRLIDQFNKVLTGMDWDKQAPDCLSVNLNGIHVTLDSLINHDLGTRIISAILRELSHDLREINSQAAMELHSRFNPNIVSHEQANQEIDEESEAFKFAESLNQPSTIPIEAGMKLTGDLTGEILATPDQHKEHEYSGGFTQEDMAEIKKSHDKLVSSAATPVKIDHNAKPVITVKSKKPKIAPKPGVSFESAAKGFGLQKMGLFAVGKSASMLIKGRKCNIIGKDSAVEAGFIINLPGSADCLVTAKGIEEFRRVLNGGK